MPHLVKNERFLSILHFWANLSFCPFYWILDILTFLLEYCLICFPSNAIVQSSRSVLIKFTCLISKSVCLNILTLKYIANNTPKIHRRDTEVISKIHRRDTEDTPKDLDHLQAFAQLGAPLFFDHTLWYFIFLYKSPWAYHLSLLSALQLLCYIVFFCYFTPRAEFYSFPFKLHTRIKTSIKIIFKTLVSRCSQLCLLIGLFLTKYDSFMTLRRIFDLFIVFLKSYFWFLFLWERTFLLLCLI